MYQNNRVLYPYLPWILEHSYSINLVLHDCIPFLLHYTIPLLLFNSISSFTSLLLCLCPYFSMIMFLSCSINLFLSYSTIVVLCSVISLLPSSFRSLSVHPCSTLLLSFFFLQGSRTLILYDCMTLFRYRLLTDFFCIAL